jgi:hypothetical protein
MTQTVTFTAINTTMPQQILAQNGQCDAVGAAMPLTYSPPSLAQAGYTPTGVAGP